MIRSFYANTKSQTITKPCNYLAFNGGRYWITPLWVVIHALRGELTKQIQSRLHLILFHAKLSAKITKKITFHTTRHSYAIMLLANGSDLMTVKELLGHKDIKSTQVYAKVIDQSKQTAINNLPSLKINTQNGNEK